jgi:hypothetical protein
MASESDSVRRPAIAKLARSLPVLLFILGASLSGAKADDWLEGHGRGHGQWKHSYPVAYATVPQWIPAQSRGTFHSYFAGRVYYGPHRHFHSVYQFPVFVDGAVVNQPYTYCGDQRFVSVAVPLPRLAFNVVLGAPAPMMGYLGPPLAALFIFTKRGTMTTTEMAQEPC